MDIGGMVMMAVARGPAAPVAGMDQLGSLIVLMDDKKRFKAMLAEYHTARDEANAALIKLSKAKDIDKALKRAHDAHAQAAEMLDAATAESVAIREKAQTWVLAQQVKLSDMEADLVQREKTMMADGKMVGKMAADKMKAAEQREHAANAREAMADKALGMAVKREAEAKAANEKWGAALEKAREVQAALGG